jgi:hypothetical protein
MREKRKEIKNSMKGINEIKRWIILVFPVIHDWS